MPLLVAIDEFASSLGLIQAHADLAIIASDPVQMQAALRLITQVCHDTEDTITSVLKIAMEQMTYALDSN